MNEFIQNYGFFVLIAVLMLVCHLAHGSHGGPDKEDRDKGPRGSGHQH